VDLTDGVAWRLSHVQAELETLRAERLRVGARIGALEDERQLLAVSLLAGVTDEEVPAIAPPPPVTARLQPTPAAPPPPSPPPPSWSASGVAGRRAARTAPREWNADRIRDVLLWTGGVLLALSVVSFVAVLWSRDDSGEPFWTAGRVAFLLFGFVVGAAVVTWALRRRLPATAEVMGTLTLAFALIDWYAVRRAGLASSLDPALWWAIGSGVVAALALGGAAIGLRAPRVTAPVLGQLAGVFAVAALDTASWWAIGFAVCAAASMAIACRILKGDRHRISVITLAIGGVLLELVAMGFAIAAVARIDDGNVVLTALAVASLGLVPATVRWLAADRLDREQNQDDSLVAIAALSLLASIVTLCNPSSIGVFTALAAVTGGIAVALAVFIVEPLRRGGGAAGVAVFGVAGVVSSAIAISALFRPASWWNDPWQLEPLARAHDHYGVHESGPPDASLGWATIAFVVAPLVAALVASPRGRRAGLVPDAPSRLVLRVALLWSIIGTAALVPIYTRISVAGAMGLLLGVALVLAGAAAAIERGRPQLAIGVLCAATVPYVSALGWALTNRTLTVVAFGVTAAAISAVAIAIRDAAARIVLAAVAVVNLLAAVCSAVLAVDGELAAAGFAVTACALLALVITTVTGRRWTRMAAFEIPAVAGAVSGAWIAASSVVWFAAALTGLTVSLVVAALGRRYVVYGWGALGAAVATVLAWFAAAGAGVELEGFVLTSMSAVILVAATVKRGPRSWLVLELLAASGLGIGTLLASPSWVWFASSLTVSTAAFVVAASGDGHVAFRWAALGAGTASVLAWFAAGGAGVDVVGFVLACTSGMILVASTLAAARAVWPKVHAFADAAIVGLIGATFVAGGSWTWVAGALTVATICVAISATMDDDVDIRWGAVGGGVATVMAWFAVAGASMEAEGLVLATLSGTLLIVASSRHADDWLVVEGLSASGLTVGVLLALGDPVWFAIVLSVAAVALVVISVLPRARLGYSYAAIGAVAGSVSAWLAAVDVRIVEAYTSTWSAALLSVGWLLRRRSPAMSSWITYGPGIVVGLGSFTLSAIDDDDLTHAVIVVTGGLVSVILGAVYRLQSPLLLGVIALATIGIDTIAPSAVEVPRWIPLGFAGLLLLWIGATAERRLSQARRVRAAFGRFG
jgi:hypothetical protein